MELLDVGVGRDCELGAMGSFKTQAFETFKAGQFYKGAGRHLLKRKRIKYRGWKWGHAQVR